MSRPSIGPYCVVMLTCDALSREKLATREYGSVAELGADVQRMYANAELYNETDSVYSREARRQRKSFRAFLRDLQ